MTSPMLAQNGFLEKQLQFERVKNAYEEKRNGLRNDLMSKGFGDQFNIYIAAYKSEEKLEIWLQNSKEDIFKLFKTYDFSGRSGTLGPKVTEGDKQTPEGCYEITVFNPESNYHLSLGINYPNQVDLIRTGEDRRTGGDIYIHGNCETVGCIALTDDKIKELYVLAVEARNNGQLEIPVYIFPFKMTDGNLNKFRTQYPQQLSFWQTMQHGYAFFEKYKTLPNVTQINGNYVIKSSTKIDLLLTNIDHSATD